ncbi:hypothetical protein YYC_02783 [Plasmodium yoelii 17X]|uniref:Early transcribed membrane protein n=3 Tax=Plasmodium yoelii TaxID=5861 RepID=A0AAE9WQC0_PLAYO|nr:early transcribed membrane protein [Plasmodium yoelii]ETB60503.1 hypothetical protein YYC_02783 [Plasmodium yoelii 17X]WBY56529.1 early transcribed membrane protein [Plasmodium yoelii yoelii]CDU17392.1 early transcribed membrane protein [Plasmodium yoelii]VTZ77060.1 early transcribed membrane protein [Plasmodium yoelii]|eukprot:XP_022811887.1 early transcribed membrane protein [Plasmodium yoelii]
MKLAKALYFVAFLLAIKVLTPGSINYVEAKPANSKKVAKGKGGDNGFIRKIKDNKAAFISTLAATVALAIATTFGVMHYQNKGNDVNDGNVENVENGENDEKKPIEVEEKKTPLITPRKNPKPDNGNTPAS